MSRFVRTTRFSGVKDTNTTMFDQNGRRITGDRPTLAAGENVAKRGAVPPQRPPSTTRVASKTRVSATVTRPVRRTAAGRAPPVAEDSDEEPTEAEINAAVEHAERVRVATEERDARNLRKMRETEEFHNKYYRLCKDKTKLEAYPGYRFGMAAPDRNDIHALGVYKMNLEEAEKQEARLQKIAAAKAAAKAKIATPARSGRPMSRTPAAARAKTPGRKGDRDIMDELVEKNRDRLERQTKEFHHKYWPLCRDKVKLEAYPGYRFGMPVPAYDDLLGVGGYMVTLRDFEAAEEAEQNQPPAKAKALTKAQKEKAERDARIAAKRTSLRPQQRKAPANRFLPPGVEESPGTMPAAFKATPAGPKPAGAKPKPKPATAGPPAVARGPPPGYHGPAYIGDVLDAQAAATPAPARAAEAEAEAAQGEVEVETETKVVVHDDMQTRILKMKQIQRGLSERPPQAAPPPQQPRMPAKTNFRLFEQGLTAQPLIPVNVVAKDGAVGRSIMVPAEVATADHSTVVRVPRGTNVAVPCDPDDDDLGVLDLDDDKGDELTAFENVHEIEFDQFAEKAFRADLEKKKETVRRLRQAAVELRDKLILEQGLLVDI